MEYRKLGTSGIRVSPICLGTMMFGDRTERAVAQRIVASARDAGVNFIDTADSYAAGASEVMTSSLIASDRDWWILATKAGNPMGPGPNDWGQSRRWLMRGLDLSLQRLKVDWVDIFYLHWDDQLTPLEELVTAMGDIVRSGKARYWGISNYRAWKITAMVYIARALNVPPPVVCQPYYNAMNRMAEAELLPSCQHHGLAVVPYSPLARGVLTGKYAPGGLPSQDTRAGRGDKRMLETEFRKESLVAAQHFRERAQARGMSAAQFAMNWVLNNALVTSVIAGPRTLEQWEDYLGAIQYGFSAEDEAFVDALVPPGHPSTPGYNDPKVPMKGRLPRNLDLSVT